jgi:hypothetical protein
MKTQTHPSRHSGFALVVTLALMILLTVIAVGLLTLSSISLRASGQGEAMATARANARLALMLALGDLQKTLGPDRAITANSEIFANEQTSSIAKPNTTGVWESWWDFDPNASPSYSDQKTSRFRRWLVSNADLKTAQSRNFVNTAWTGKTIELVGDGSLGANANDSAKVTAGLVPISVGKTKGSYAWHVADESVKARINVYRDPNQNTTLAQKRALLAGHRPDPSVMKGADGTSPTFLPTDLKSSEFTDAKEKSSKLLDLDQVELLDQAKGKVKQFRNDMTPYSLGLLTDVRRGGLKQDLSSVFEMTETLPTEFNNKKLYESTHGITGVSDPYWTTLAGYYNSFRTITTPETTPILVLPATATALTGPGNEVPKTFFPGPVIAKVETVFSLVTREDASTFMHTRRNAADIRKKCAYAVNLIFTPQITLHNPYNVQISFHRLTVTLNNVPVAFQFFRDGIGPGSGSQSVNPGEFECMNQMLQNRHLDDDDPSTPSGTKINQNKKFVVHIGNWTDTTPYSNANIATQTTNGDIVMKPGQTLVCTPFLDPGLTFSTDSHINTDNNLNPVVFFDYNNRITTRGLKAKPGITPGLGFEINGISPSHKTGRALTQEMTPLSPDQEDGNSYWWFLLRDNTGENPVPSESNSAQDKYYVQYKIQQPQYWPNGTPIAPGAPLTKVDATFEVSATIKPTATGIEIDYAKLSFEYGNNSNLQTFFGNQTYRYPPSGWLFGKSSTDTNTTYVSQNTSLNSQANVKPFAVFSAYARTTNGGADDITGSRSSTDSLKDGRLAGKPFLFHNPSRAIVTMDLATGKPGAQAYELNFQPFSSKGDYDIYMDASVDPLTQFARIPAITANTTTRGIKSGSYLEIPTGPMQTIADFRRSNALTSSYLPQFVQPVGNSLLHPLMSSNKVIESSSAISATPLLDHSILANHAFYDRFYFSTFATRGSEKPDAVFEKFMNYTTPLPSQAFLPHRANGQSVADAKAALFSSGKPNEEAYKTAAEYQLVQSPFNVNSTSVQAWKAVLASMNKSNVATFWAKNATLDTVASPGVPIMGMSLLNGGLIGSNTDPAKIDGSATDPKTNDWNGYRELNDAQLTSLAEAIVKQVRQRGPFLSMSEFVNRQVGSESALTLSGALENAISDSKINDTFMTGNVTPLATSDFSDTALYNYKTPAATIGNPAAGAPGWISQGDLLRILEPGATVRSDTFVIRVYGDAKDASGAITARAYAEAVVQRVPEYVDPVNPPSVNVYTDAKAATANKTFGRRMNVVSFRWLSSNEI